MPDGNTFSVIRHRRLINTAFVLQGRAHRLRIVRIYQDSYMSSTRNCLFEQLKPFRVQFRIEVGRSSYVSAWPREAGDESRRDRIARHSHDNRNRRSCLLSRSRPGSSAGDDSVNL
jgi:hypothetical protein